MRQIFEYIDSMLKADRLEPPEELLEYVFSFYDWESRPPVSHTPAITRGDAITQSIALLSHADTDLVTLENARASLPPGITVFDYALNSVGNEEQMQMLLQGRLAQSRVVLLRLHGPLSSVPGFCLLQAMSTAGDRFLVVVSGTGELIPEFLQARNVPRTSLLR